MSINLAKKIAWTILVDKGLTFDNCRQNMRGFYSKSRPVNDIEMKKEVKNLYKDYNYTKKNKFLFRFKVGQL